MKTKLILATFFASSLFLNGQNTSWTTSGNIGIGTTSPINKLDVIDNSGGSLHAGIGGTAPSLKFFQGNTSPSGGGPWAPQWCRVGMATGTNHFIDQALSGDMIIQNIGTTTQPFTGNGRSIIFSSRFEYGNGVEHMRINEHGNVGIGTNSPGYGLLHVEQSSNNNFSSAYFGSNLSNPSGMNRSLQVEATNADYCWAGVFIAGNVNATQNIGIYAATPGGYPVNDYAGYFEGHLRVKQNLNVDGIAYCTNMMWGSDKKLKKEIQPLKNSLAKINELKPSSYLFRKDEFTATNLPEGRQLGLIAQELELVFPELVSEKAEQTSVDRAGKIIDVMPAYKVVNYIGLIPVLIAGIQEQQTQIENQQQQINELKALVQSIAGNTSKQSEKVTGIPVSLSDKNTIVLNQNVPNPFAESTVITYNIPHDFTKAQILFNGIDGVVIKVIDITQKGNGSLHVFADDLSHGMYSYQLVVDGKVVDTKKMVKQ